MGFPVNWGQDAADRLAALARRTVRLAMEQVGTWGVPSPRLRAAVRYSAGYDVATAARMAPVDTFGRRVCLTAPHFEIRVDPGGDWRPAGATFYQVGPERAARVLSGEWASAIFAEPSPVEARAVTEALLGPLGDLAQVAARTPPGRAGGS